MKTELLLAAVFFGVLSAWTLICWLHFFIINEESRRRFFNIGLKVCLLKEKSWPVILLFILIIVAIIGLAWSLITISSIYENVSLISLSLITAVLMVIVLYLIRRTK